MHFKTLSCLLQCRYGVGPFATSHEDDSHLFTRQRERPFTGTEGCYIQRATRHGGSRDVAEPFISNLKVLCQIDARLISYWKILSIASYNAWRYNSRMISTFICRETEKIWTGLPSGKLPPHIQSRARRKLRMLNNAQNLQDLRIPPANRLEALHGNRAGQHSIRINDQYRICFIWRQGNAYQVEIVDYH